MKFLKLFGWLLLASVSALFAIATWITLISHIGHQNPRSIDLTLSLAIISPPVCIVAIVCAALQIRVVWISEEHIARVA